MVSDEEIHAAIRIFNASKNYYIKNPDLNYSLKNVFISKLVKDETPKNASASWIKEVFPDENFLGRIYIERIALYVSALYARKNQHENMINFLLGIMQENPLFFWDKNNLKALKYNLVQSLKLQSRIVPADITRVLDNLEGSNPVLASIENFKKYKKIISNWSDSLQEIDKKREATWDRIITTAHDKKIKLILQTYPSGYTSANAMARKISKRYNLPLVDNNLHFQKLIEKEGREKYLFDDDHATPAGYKIISDNVERVIQSL